MQFSRRQRPRGNGDESILPLTNVVFLLLIFFMLAGRLASPEAFDIQPPVSTSEAQARRDGLEIQLSAGGDIAIDGQAVDLDALEERVGEQIEANPALALRLKADGAGDATRVVAVMQALRDAGGEKLRLITIAPE
ncbi:biopolymer transporter ExbD [Endozoicomonas sp. G2_2]|uniref:ExbD/TolR family protein n=1 Tax=Endozoicomonas sp. G2_2 TaxID=2821092 RepID=UPI001ADC2A5E|nr:biopolymer transporter ExbD [Endozoicomonas sp. G2_2]MBO9470986.1 biopolymer transporter ExbD [Endozoicomonas sp. G2_2]